MQFLLIFKDSVHPRMASSRQSTNSDIPLDYFEGHESMDLATFLIKIACQNSPIAIFLYWFFFLILIF